eukprot:6181898-Pleurochrysis_carterae.AAC.6
MRRKASSSATKSFEAGDAATGARARRREGPRGRASKRFKASIRAKEEVSARQWSWRPAQAH